MPRSYIPSYGPDQQTVRAGLLWASTRNTPVLLAVCQKSNLEGTIEDVVGEAAARVLTSGSSVKLGNASLTLLTLRDRRSDWRGAVLAVYPDRKLLDKIDSFSASDVVVVPWRQEDVQFWIDTWAAVQLGAPAVVSGVSGPSVDPIVVAALEELTASVNLSTGVTDPRDRASAIEAFEILRDGAIAFSPAAVRAWLVAERRWEPEHANEVEGICSDVLAHKRLRGERGRWPGALDRWRGTASGAT